MKVRSGMTRIVFIFETIVIKIPKIPVFLFIERFLKHASENNVGYIIEKHAIDCRYIIGFLLAGIHANRTEYQYSKQHPKKKGIIPVKRMILWCILIQPRGEEVLLADRRWKRFFRNLVKKEVPEQADVLRPENYSYWNNRIHLHDYGSPYTVLYLNSF